MNDSCVTPESILLFSLETILGIDLKLLAWRSQFKDFDKFVIVQDSVALSCAPAYWNVLDAFGDEDKRLAVAHLCVHRVLIDEAFDVKLPQDKLLAGAIVAEQPPVLVNLAFGVLSCGGYVDLFFTCRYLPFKTNWYSRSTFPLPGCPLATPSHEPMKYFRGS